MAFRPVMQKPQTDWLLQHFKSTPSISGQEAGAMFRIRALPRRIKDLEEGGHRFARENRFDTTGQRYVRYHYLGKKSAA
jgi:hypothetical protein